MKVGDLIPIGGSGNVKKSEVLTGKTYSSDEGVDLVGTMPNRGTLNKHISSKGQSVTISPGYYSGGKVSAKVGDYNVGDTIPTENININYDIITRVLEIESSQYIGIMNADKYDSLYLISQPYFDKYNKDGNLEWSQWSGHNAYSDMFIDNKKEIIATISRVGDDTKIFTFDGEPIIESTQVKNGSGIVVSNNYIYITDGQLVKLDMEFNRIYRKDVTTSASQYIRADSKGDLIITDSSKYIFKINPSGNQVWRIRADNDITNLIIDSKDNIIITTSGDDRRLIKYDSNGKELFTIIDFASIGVGVDIDSKDNIYTMSNKFMKINPEGEVIAIDYELRWGSYNIAVTDNYIYRKPGGNFSKTVRQYTNTFGIRDITLKK